MEEVISIVESVLLNTQRKLEGIESVDTITGRKALKNLHLQKMLLGTLSLGEHLSLDKSMKYKIGTNPKSHSLVQRSKMRKTQIKNNHPWRIMTTLF